MQSPKEKNFELLTHMKNFFSEIMKIRFYNAYYSMLSLKYLESLSGRLLIISKICNNDI